LEPTSARGNESGRRSDLWSGRVGFAVTDLHAAAHTRLIKSAQRVSRTHFRGRPGCVPLVRLRYGRSRLSISSSHCALPKQKAFVNGGSTRVCGPLLRACPSFRPPRALSNAPSACPSAATRGPVRGGGLVRSAGQPEMGPHLAPQAFCPKHMYRYLRQYTRAFCDIHQNPRGPAAFVRQAVCGAPSFFTRHDALL
jgi:hypothetical protein